MLSYNTLITQLIYPLWITDCFVFQGDQGERGVKGPQGKDGVQGQRVCTAVIVKLWTTTLILLRCLKKFVFCKTVLEKWLQGFWSKWLVLMLFTMLCLNSVLTLTITCFSSGQTRKRRTAWPTRTKGNLFSLLTLREYYHNNQTLVNLANTWGPYWKTLPCRFGLKPTLDLKWNIFPYYGPHIL